MCMQAATLQRRPFPELERATERIFGGEVKALEAGNCALLVTDICGGRCVNTAHHGQSTAVGSHGAGSSHGD